MFHNVFNVLLCFLNVLPSLLMFHLELPRTEMFSHSFLHLKCLTIFFTHFLAILRHRRAPRKRWFSLNDVISTQMLHFRKTRNNSSSSFMSSPDDTWRPRGATFKAIKLPESKQAQNFILWIISSGIRGIVSTHNWNLVGNYFRFQLDFCFGFLLE